jgi:hypothetical protein
MDLMKAKSALLGMMIAGLGVAASMAPSTAHATQTITPITCTENTCIAYICTSVPGAGQHCTIGIVPRLPNWGPGYPEEP